MATVVDKYQSTYHKEYMTLKNLDSWNRTRRQTKRIVFLKQETE